MKSFIVGLLFLSLTSLSLAQEKKSLSGERVDQLPEVVLKVQVMNFLFICLIIIATEQ